MPKSLSLLRLDQPATYQIVLQGRLDSSWKEWFGGMTVRINREGGSSARTTLTGPVRDQAELHGLLARIRDLCLPLIRVQLLPVAPNSSDDPES